MTINFDVINNTMGKKVAQSEKELGEFAESMDPNNAADLIKFQQKVQEWNMITNLQSTTMKSLKDTCSSIIQRMQ